MRELMQSTKINRFKQTFLQTNVFFNVKLERYFNSLYFKHILKFIQSVILQIVNLSHEIFTQIAVIKIHK